MMDKKRIAARLLSLAKRILVADMTWDECIANAKKNPDVRDPEALCGWLKAHGPNASMKEAQEWTPARKDVDVRRRNQEVLKSLTTYAPGLGKELKKRMAKELQKQGYDVDAIDLSRVWSQYLTYIDLDSNNNKYHYYAIYSFEDNGLLLYVAANCSGRIGIIERAYDLTKKYGGGPATSERGAMAALDRHLRSKLSKGYQKVKMTRG